MDSHTSPAERFRLIAPLRDETIRRALPPRAPSMRIPAFPRRAETLGISCLVVPRHNELGAVHFPPTSGGLG